MTEGGSRMCGPCLSVGCTHVPTELGARCDFLTCRPCAAIAARQVSRPVAAKTYDLQRESPQAGSCGGLGLVALLTLTQWSARASPRSHCAHGNECEEGLLPCCFLRILDRAYGSDF